MRIAILCPDASRNPLVRTYPIAKVLARRHQLQVLGFRTGDDIFEPYRHEFAYDTLKLRPLPGFLGQVRELASRVRADAIFAFKPLPSTLWVGLLAKRALKVPLFLDVEDWETGWFRDRSLRHALGHLIHLERPHGFFWTAFTESLIPWCDEVFVVSRFLERRFGGTLLRHGADTDVFDPSRITAEEALARLGLPKGRYAVFTGSPMPNKGLGDLLAAVEALAEPALKVLVVGSFDHDPAYREELRRRHGNRLLLLGPRPHSEMPLFLALADLVALPQQACRETVAQVPGKVFEAMAMARPILATAVGDLPEILEGCAIVVPPASSEALVAGLARILHQPAEARELGRRARLRCVQHFSWDAMESILAKRLERWEGT